MHNLITDLDTIRQLTQQRESENVRFRQFVKYRLAWSDARLDAVVLGVAREVQAAVDCTRCANCCRSLEVSLDDSDLARLGARLGLSAEDVGRQYTAPGRQCERTFAQRPCPFLQDHRCMVYTARPRDCREYPHLEKGKFRTRMWQVLGHAEDCPIVFNVLERLKRELWSQEDLLG